MTFLYQRVFDHTKNIISTLTPLPEEYINDDLSFLGPEISSEHALQIAVGNMDPHTLCMFETPSKTEEILRNSPTVFRTNGSKTSRPLLPVQKNSISNYFTPMTKASTKPFVPPRTKLKTIPESSPSSPPKRAKTESSSIEILVPRTPSPPKTSPKKNHHCCEQIFHKDKRKKQYGCAHFRERYRKFQEFTNSKKIYKSADKQFTKTITAKEPASTNKSCTSERFCVSPTKF